MTTPAHAGTTGHIAFPCTDPSWTYDGVTSQGTCGYQIDLKGADRDHFKLVPQQKADLDLYFYDKDGNVIDSYTGGRVSSCGEIVDDGQGVPPKTRTVVVVLSAWPTCAAQSNVSFVFSTF